MTRYAIQISGAHYFIRSVTHLHRASFGETPDLCKKLYVFVEIVTSYSSNKQIPRPSLSLIIQVRKPLYCSEAHVPSSQCEVIRFVQTACKDKRVRRSEDERGRIVAEMMTMKAA